MIRIGEFAHRTDLFLRRLQLENTRKNRIMYIGICDKPCNQQLFKMFRRKLFIIQNENKFARKILSDIVYKKNSILRKSVFYMDLPYTLSPYYEFNNTEPNLFFTDSEQEEGKKLLNKMGVADNSWFVCFLSRDPAYLDKHHGYRSREQWAYHDYRDSDVKNYLEAMKYTASLGGYAVRMGHTVAEKLPDLDNPRIIDYATHHRTDFGDIYLSAKCKFFLGSATGLWLIPTIFHVPFAGANWCAPFEHTPFRKGDLFIPKKVWSIEKKRFLTFCEILESGAGCYLRTEQFTEAGLEVVENTSEEILDLAKEMNEQLDGTFEIAEQDEELQKRFKSLFKRHHVGYGSPARIGTKFLQQNKELLG